MGEVRFKRFKLAFLAIKPTFSLLKAVYRKKKKNVKNTDSHNGSFCLREKMFLKDSITNSQNIWILTLILPLITLICECSVINSDAFYFGVSFL